MKATVTVVIILLIAATIYWFVLQKKASVKVRSHGYTPYTGNDAAKKEDTATAAPTPVITDSFLQSFDTVIPGYTYNTNIPGLNIDTTIPGLNFH